ncbi:tetratricopeptide repeat protein [Streptomyces sp. TLI_146]|uniref:tetratricopeptide repeat protein n=1 Tax=Streptomyces sp. TLI_146 TaxID=1938858 RepID=UPI0015D63657|nr:tetratricopeptide repeat protein [Streptomyces sp. TLI_146]
MGDLFVGRTEEQARFARVLGNAAGRTPGGPDEGFVVLVRGYGGIGKSTLLRRFAAIAAGGVPAVPVRPGRFVVALVDWEDDRKLPRVEDDYALFEGPPVWKVLERVRAALESAAAPGWRRRRRVGKAFEGFVRQVARMKELEEEASRLGIGGVLGRRQVTPEQMARIVKAGTDLAGVAGAPGAVTVPVARAAEAGAGLLSAAREGRAQRVDPELYRALVDAVDAVVTAFADGVREVAKRWPVVVVLDTCELLGGSGPWLREVTRRCGRRVVWVLGLRLEPELEAVGDSEAARYRDVLHEQRLTAIDVTRFDNRTVEDFLTRQLGGTAAEPLDLGRILSLTQGVPLAVSLLSRLLADRLGRGHPVDDLYDEIADSGQVSSVVAGMARRYLVHASREDSDLHQDLPLLVGLALVHHGQDTPWPTKEFDPLDRLHETRPRERPPTREPELLAALWDQPAHQVAATLAGLARRHDFVSSGSGSMHRDVRDAIRLHLLTPTERVRYTAMNQRAVELLTARLHAMAHATTEDQLTDPDWRSAAASLLWHTCWVDPAQGPPLLRHLYPAAHVLQPAFARLLLDVISRFTAYCPARDQHLPSNLQTLTGQPDAAQPHHSRTALRALMDWLTSAPTPSPPFLIGPAEPYYHLLRAFCHRQLGLGLPERVAAVRHAAAVFPPGSGLTANRIGGLADGIDHFDPASLPAPEQDALLEGRRLTTRYHPNDARAHNNLGVVLTELGRFPQAEDALREAIRLDPNYAIAHDSLGWTLIKLGRFPQAGVALREAIRLDPNDAIAHNNLGVVLTELGRFPQAEDALREAIRLDPNYATAHNDLGVVLTKLGRFPQAEDALREAIRLDPNDAIAHNNLGWVLTELGRFPQAEDALREAIRLDPNYATAHGHLGRLRLVDGDWEAARTLLSRASSLSDGALPKVELLLWAMDRAGPTPAAASRTARAVLDAVGKPSPARTLPSPFGDAEARALALAGLGEANTAAQVLRSAAAVRTPGDRFTRPIYDLLAQPQPIAGLDELLQVWREIIATDPSAAGPWGGPSD